MFIKRQGDKNDCIVAGMVVADMRVKEFEGSNIYEIPVSMGKDAGIVNVSLWNRKPCDIKKYDHIFAAGQLKVNKGTDKEGKEKTYYSLSADFVMKEQSENEVKETQPELEPIDDDDLPF